MAVKRRRKFDERKVNRWPSKTPGSKGGQFAPGAAGGGGGPDWADRLSAQMPAPAYRPGNWQADHGEQSRIGYEKEIRRILTESGLTEAEINKGVEDVRKDVPAPIVTLRNGPHTIQDHVGLPGKTLEAIADLYDVLIQQFPPADGGPAVVTIVPMQGMPSFNPIDPDTYGIRGETVGGSGTVWLNANGFTSPPQGMHFMPAFDQVPPMAYYIAHEWGHTVDQDSSASDPKTVTFFENHKRQMSGYGQTQAAEAYAEAFAEWFLSQGTTWHPQAQAYAKEYGWPVPKA